MYKLLNILFICLCFTQTSVANLVVGILDDHTNTDIVIYIDHHAKRIIWIPRDTFSWRTRTKINAVYHRGGHKLLIRALNDLGFDARFSIVLRKDQTKSFLKDIQLTVPVPYNMEYNYPLTIDSKVEKGEYKKITFTPPT